jgi:RND family efflux transporter MFP subunit
VTDPSDPNLADAKPGRHAKIPRIIVAGIAGVLLLGGMMFVRAASRVNKVPLSGSKKGVTVVRARAGQYRPTRKYIGTIEPWIEAKIGPQFTAAYIDTVLVRPEAFVKKGQVMATLDCRNASAESHAVAAQARAVEAQQEALAHEAARVSELKAGGFASPNEIENKSAESASKEAELQATKARMARASLEVNDCILRAPFDGEVADRTVDPGAFVRPGTAVVSIVDRRTVRITADVPESDFALVAAGTPVRLHLLATGKDMAARIARRSPAADASTRTIRVEVDLADPERTIPVGTTAELSIDAGTPLPAIEVPLIAGSVRGDKASLYVLDGDVAKRVTVPIQGELGGTLFLGSEIQPGALVVTEGHAQLADGDHVWSKIDSDPASASGGAHP